MSVPSLQHKYAPKQNDANCRYPPLLSMTVCVSEREGVKVGELAKGGEEIGCQYMLWAEKMSKTDMAMGLRDTGCSLHGIVA